MGISRRGFFGSVGAGAAGLLGFLGLDLQPTISYAATKLDELKRTELSTTICPYCAVGCGALVMSEVRGGRRTVVNIEGDPDHPINEGTLCSKGSSLYQLANNERRLQKVLYRAPGASDFEEKSWDWAAKTIAQRIKKTRDATFMEKNAKGQRVNRTDAIASVGSAALDNEECWLYQTFLRSMGLGYVEHQARI